MQEETTFDELSTDTFENTTKLSEKSVIIFTASWCGPCKSVKPKIPAISKEYGVTPFWIDIEKNMDITQKYNIHAVPFIITMRSGEAVNSMATNNVQKITEMISKL